MSGWLLRPWPEPKIDNANTMMLSYRTGHYPDVTRDFLPRATRMIDVNWQGNVEWDWMPAEQFEQFGHSEAARNAIMRHCRNQHGVFQNTISYVGPNQWYDAGDERFHPNNIISDDRGTMLYIISRRPKRSCGRLDRTTAWIEVGHSAASRAICAYDSARASGAGNVLVFDNGGAGGFGDPNPNGTWNALRDHSRVLEINPVTLELVEFTALTGGFGGGPGGGDISKFYSRYKSAAQRLPNGNTLITESCCGRAFEVTRDGEVVWEFTNPNNLAQRDGLFVSDIFRAYRYPYEWVPQLDQPRERAVVPPRHEDFRIAPVDD